ncbi:MAG: sigma-70 family RNA polymerase sigma factor [Micrococcales bacterium]|nr:sigma-70 family RNA polymerase sigma factor [Micrococcales bacterium]
MNVWRELGELSDRELIDLARVEDSGAWAELWSRHRNAALAAARSQPGNADPEDLVAEAFTRILELLRRGGGPAEEFRPYLYATVRNLALKSLRGRSVAFSCIDMDPDEFEDEGAAASVDARLRTQTDVEMLTRAMSELPERWQEVLRLTEVEQLKPAEIAEVIGVGPNAVAALAYRARRALRAAWLQQHVQADSGDPECTAVLEEVGRVEAGTAPAAVAAQVADHLAGCDACRLLVQDALASARG